MSHKSARPTSYISPQVSAKQQKLNSKSKSHKVSKKLDVALCPKEEELLLSIKDLQIHDNDRISDNIMLFPSLCTSYDQFIVQLVTSRGVGEDISESFLDPSHQHYFYHLSRYFSRFYSKNVDISMKLSNDRLFKSYLSHFFDLHDINSIKVQIPKMFQINLGILLLHFSYYQEECIQILKEYNICDILIAGLLQSLSDKKKPPQELSMAVSCLAFIVNYHSAVHRVLTNNNTSQLLKLLLSKSIYVSEYTPKPKSSSSTQGYDTVHLLEEWEIVSARLGLRSLLALPAVMKFSSVIGEITSFIEKWWSRIIVAVQATEDPTSVPQNATIYETPGKTTNRNVSPIKCAIEVLSDIFKQIRHYREMMQGDTFASSPSIEDISIIQQHIHQIKRTVIDLVFANSHLKGNTSSNYSFLLHYVSSQDPRTAHSHCHFMIELLQLLSDSAELSNVSGDDVLDKDSLKDHLKDMSKEIFEVVTLTLHKRLEMLAWNHFTHLDTNMPSFSSSSLLFSDQSSLLHAKPVPVDKRDKRPILSSLSHNDTNRLYGQGSHGSHGHLSEWGGEDVGDGLVRELMWLPVVMQLSNLLHESLQIYMSCSTDPSTTTKMLKSYLLNTLQSTSELFDVNTAHDHQNHGTCDVVCVLDILLSSYEWMTKDRKDDVAWNNSLFCDTELRKSILTVMSMLNKLLEVNSQTINNTREATNSPNAIVALRKQTFLVMFQYEERKSTTFQELLNTSIVNDTSSSYDIENTLLLSESRELFDKYKQYSAQSYNSTYNSTKTINSGGAWIESNSTPIHNRLREDFGDVDVSLNHENSLSMNQGYFIYDINTQHIVPYVNTPIDQEEDDTSNGPGNDLQRNSLSHIGSFDITKRKHVHEMDIVRISDDGNEDMLMDSPVLACGDNRRRIGVSSSRSHVVGRRERNCFVATSVDSLEGIPHAPTDSDSNDENDVENDGFDTQPQSKAAKEYNYFNEKQGAVDAHRNGDDLTAENVSYVHNRNDKSENGDEDDENAKSRVRVDSHVEEDEENESAVIVTNVNRSIYFESNLESAVANTQDMTANKDFTYDQMKEVIEKDSVQESDSQHDMDLPVDITGENDDEKDQSLSMEVLPANVSRNRRNNNNNSNRGIKTNISQKDHFSIAQVGNSAFDSTPLVNKILTQDISSNAQTTQTGGDVVLLRQHNLTLTQQIIQMQHTITNLNSDVLKWQTKYDDVKVDNTELLTKVNNLNKVKITNESNIATFKDMLMTSTSRNKELEMKCIELQYERDQTNKEITQKNTLLQDSYQKLTEISKYCNDLKLQNGQQGEKVAIMDAKCSSFEHNVMELTLEKQSLKELQTQIVIENDNLKFALQKQTVNNEDTQARLSKLQQDHLMVVEQKNSMSSSYEESIKKEDALKRELDLKTNELRQMMERYAQDMSVQKKTYDSYVHDVKEEKEQAEKEHAGKVFQLEKENSEKILRLEKEHSEKVSRLEKEHSVALHALQIQYDELLQRYAVVETDLAKHKDLILYINKLSAERACQV